MDLDSIYLHMHGFNTGFVFYAGDASFTAWRSKENRPAIWREPSRRYKHSVLKLLFDDFIVIHLNHLESVSLMHPPPPPLHTDCHTLIMDWLLSSVFASGSQFATAFPVSRGQASEKQLPPSVCSQGQSVWLHRNIFLLHTITFYSVAPNVVLEYLEMLFCLRLRCTAWWPSVWGSCAPHCTFLTSWGWRSGPVLSTRWSTALTSW